MNYQSGHSACGPVGQRCQGQSCGAVNLVTVDGLTRWSCRAVVPLTNVTPEPFGRCSAMWVTTWCEAVNPLHISSAVAALFTVGYCQLQQPSVVEHSGAAQHRGQFLVLLTRRTIFPCLLPLYSCQSRTQQHVRCRSCCGAGTATSRTATTHHRTRLTTISAARSSTAR